MITCARFQLILVPKKDWQKSKRIEWKQILMNNFYRKRPSAEETLEHRWLQPSEHMLKKRERASFFGNRLKVCYWLRNVSSLLHIKNIYFVNRNTPRNTTNNEDWYQLHLQISFRLLVWVWVVQTAIKRIFLQHTNGSMELSTVLSTLAHV